MLGLACAFFAFGSAKSVASVVSDPQYFVRAIVVEIASARGGLHTVSFIIKGESRGRSCLLIFY